MIPVLNVGKELCILQHVNKDLNQDRGFREGDTKNEEWAGAPPYWAGKGR